MKTVKKKVVLLLTCLLIACLTLAAFAETKITVSGTGVVLIPADTAVVTLGITVQKSDVLDAQNEVNAKIEAIRSALIAAGFEKEDINTDRLSIRAVYDYSQEGERIVGYNAQSYLAIRTLDMEKVGEIIDIAFTSGANTLNDIVFSASESAEADKESLTLSVKNAMEKAETIASAAGLKITGIESITESYSYRGDSGVNSFYKTAAAEDSAAGVATTVQAAKISVTANVNVIFTAE